MKTLIKLHKPIINFSRQIFALLFVCLLLLCSNKTYADTTNLSDNQPVQNFINTMVRQYNFDSKELTNLLDSTTLVPEVLPSIQHPYEEKPWYIYKNHLLTQQRLDLGLEYWQRHAEALRYAENKFGVPASIIVAIIGIESLYGQAHLKYPVLNTLVTLSFSYPSRASFFQSELMNYLLLTRELNIDPKTIYGSYAGAIGLPQFMPSSYRHFAIAYPATTTPSTTPQDNENRLKLGDLTNDNDDVIVSVANYLNHFGWEKGENIALAADVSGEEYQKLLSKTLKPTYSIDQYKKHGIKPIYKIPQNAKATLIQLQNEIGYEYWLGLNNFYVLTKYNSDKQYVMAVYQLALALKHARVNKT